MFSPHELGAGVSRGRDGRCLSAPFPSVKVYNLLFLEAALCPGCYQAGLSAGAMAHTRAGPSSALQICPAISKLLSLCNPSGTGVTHTAGREGGTSNVYIRDLPGNCIFLFYISQLLVSFFGTEYFKIRGYFTWAVVTLRLKSGEKIRR